MSRPNRIEVRGYVHPKADAERFEQIAPRVARAYRRSGFWDKVRHYQLAPAAGDAAATVLGAEAAMLLRSGYSPVLLDETVDPTRLSAAELARLTPGDRVPIRLGIC